MEIRAVTENDLPEMSRLISLAFERGEPWKYTAEDLARDHAVGIYQNGRLVATLGTLHFHLLFGTDRRPCGGITNVICAPAYRGQGFASALLKQSLVSMREQGQYLSNLWPFDLGFYQKYGWDWTGENRAYTFYLESIASYPESHDVEEVREQHADIFNPVYEAVASRYNGAVVRDAHRWEQEATRFYERIPTSFVYRKGGKAEGYLVVRFTSRKEEGRARLVAVTARAYRGLLGTLHHHAMTFEKMKLEFVPADDPLWGIVTGWDTETRHTFAGMGRIVELVSAFAALKPAPTLRGRIVLQVKDKYADWNAGTWRIEVEAGQVAAARTDESPGVSLDIRALSQAYWGTPDLAALRFIERVTVRDEAQYALLRELLPPRIVWLPDDF